LPQNYSLYREKTRGKYRRSPRGLDYRKRVWKKELCPELTEQDYARRREKGGNFPLSEGANLKTKKQERTEGGTKKILMMRKMILDPGCAVVRPRNWAIRNGI